MKVAADVEPEVRNIHIEQVEPLNNYDKAASVVVEAEKDVYMGYEVVEEHDEKKETEQENEQEMNAEAREERNQDYYTKQKKDQVKYEEEAVEINTLDLQECVGNKGNSEDDEALEHRVIYKGEKTEQEKNLDETNCQRQRPKFLHGAA